VSAAGIDFITSGVEAHFSLGIGERYHAPLCNIYNKVLLDHPNLTQSKALALGSKALNDTAGPNGLTPTRLVFGVSPRLPASTVQLPDQDSRFTAMSTARQEMERTVAQLRLTQAMRGIIPPAAHLSYKSVDRVWAYRERHKRWFGPMEVLAADNKIAVVLDGTAPRRADGHPVPQRLNAATVKQYNSPDPTLAWFGGLSVRLPHTMRSGREEIV
jgi:hypothetical protein